MTSNNGLFRYCGVAPRLSLRRAIIGATAAWLAVSSHSSFAEHSACALSVTSVNFGAYSVFSLSPNNISGGGITITCTNSNGDPFDVTLSTGQSNNYASRVMVSGVNTLNYNLYTSAARTSVWGDGTGGSSVMAADKDHTTTLSVFGQIPAGQDASVGIYTDRITVVVNF